MSSLTSPQIAQFHRDGFLVVPGVFSEEEIFEISRAGRAATDGKPGELSTLAINGLDRLWCDERLLCLARLLISTTPVFYASADYGSRHIPPDWRPTTVHLHHDAKGTPEHLFSRLHAQPTNTYPILRLGIYLQDYESLSGGIKVSPGSHTIDTSHFDQTSLPFVDISPKRGDVVCFCHRILHSALALRLKNSPHTALSPLAEAVGYLRDSTDFLPLPEIRETVFVDFTDNSELADLHIKSRAVFESSAAVNANVIGRFKIHNPGGVDLRLDKIAVSLAVAAARAIKDGHKDEAAKLLRNLPMICRLSKETSPHFSLFSLSADGDSPEIAMVLANDILRRSDKLLRSYGTRAIDQHMSVMAVTMSPTNPIEMPRFAQS